MKKTLIALSVLMSASSFAAPMDVTMPAADSHDAASAQVVWKAELPTVMAGKWVTLKGEGGYDIAEGKFVVNNDGTFSSETPVVLELHYWNETTGEVGDIVSTGDAYVDGSSAALSKLGTVAYTTSDVTFTSALGADVSGMKALVSANDVIMSPTVPKDSSALGITGEHVTSWKIESAPTNSLDVMAGDTIEAKAVVSVDLAFAAAS
ncbi:hypothetical protein J7G16_004593 [Vibrio parahaemolyticus]|nr:hypothetical protein [Vibrio parahaemolyticus]